MRNGKNRKKGTEIRECLSFIPVAVVKYPYKSNLREKRLIWLTFLGSSPVLQGSQDRRNLKQSRAESKELIHECL